ncbi:cytochrome P450 reductase 2 [Paraphaeosphaeria sporulosa]|uniref:NADPH--cytochrome P450 reductase n=1 Tax=Paraphaeosphaeria sporulosa TaxID=1460663 RepID=A0A177BYQ6_9PLEO|nr:cytochrome P450 reductase 2 [Paraphaeosphaeria sporulosa]OAG00503.1 cytochrome P450 reductase 2 [Paraphaeosphaeria sporulosa]
MESFTFPVKINELPSTLNPLLRTLQSSSILPALKPSSVPDGIAAFLFLLSALGYVTRGRLWDKPDLHYKVWFERPQLAGGASSIKGVTTRNVAQRLEEGDYQAVIFWGSQSGTAERFAETLGRECYTIFGINALVADISDYDAESIADLQQKHFAIFLLSTYGEGDPSDNAAGLWDWIKRNKDQATRVESLRYLAFGLGNSNYKYYNRVLDVVVDALDAAGATSLIPPQRADDAEGATEEDFQSWKDDLFALFRVLGYEQKAVAYQPTVSVEFGDSAQSEKDDSVHQISVHHQQTSLNSAIFPLPVRISRELFTAGDRNCIHMELDLGNNDVVYKTGDHIGIWPCNPDEEVERLLETLGLSDRRKDTLTIVALDDSAKPKVPSGSTLEAALRHHLEICASVSRKIAFDLAQFAPTPEARAMLTEIGQDRTRYEQFTSSTHITLARLLKLSSPLEPWTALPLSFVLENLLSLQPRYYSISSSSVISPRRIALTALVVNKEVADENKSTIHGLSSNYLLSASKLPSNAKAATPSFQHTSSVSGEVGTVFAHVRKSKFKLPITSSTPLVLIAAGTGFAPFRAFLAERAKLHALGKPVGRMLLFFGCRSPESDYIYRDELEKLQETLGDRLQIVTAFSRDGNNRKVYVQDRVAEESETVLEMLNAGANMYICGKAGMAREVDGKIEEAATQQKGMNGSEVKNWSDGLKKRGKWRADVWG